MSKYDDLRKAAGITPVASSTRKGKTIGGGVNFSTRDVTQATSDNAQDDPAPSPRPVRPTQMVSMPSFDVTQSPLLRDIAANPPSDTPIQDIIANGTSKLANLPVIKPALQGIGKAFEYIEDLPGIKQVGGALAGAYNTIAESPSAPSSEWISQARKNLADLATSDSGLEPLKTGVKNIISGAMNPEEARAKKDQIIESRTQGLGPVSKFGYQMLSQGATDPLSLIPVGGVGRVSKLANGSGDLLKASPKTGVSALREITAPRLIEEPTPPKPLTDQSNLDEVLQAVQQPRVRDRVYNFLDEQEQAARKRIKGRKNYLSANPIPEYGDYAIIGAAKLGKGTIKATDWTEEMVKELGEDFRQHAPKVYQQAKEILRQQERKASKEGQAADAFNAGDGDASTFEQKINREVNGRRKSFSQMTEQMRTQFTDRMAALEGLEKRVSGKVASADKSLYKSARLFAGVSEKANQVITDRLAPVVKSVEAAKYTSDDLGRYALAKHAKDVNEAGYISGYTNAEIDDVIRKYENDPVMEQARQQLIQVNKDMLDSLVDAGVTSPQLRDTLNERWKNYIPLFRSFEEDPETFAAGLGQSLKSIGDPVKVLKGSKRQVIDPLENMVKNIYQSVTAAERNKVKLQLSKLAKADKEQNFIRRLKDNNVSVMQDGKMVRYDVAPEEYQNLMNMDQAGRDKFAQGLAKDPKAKFLRLLSDTESVGKKNVIPVRENGETVRYEVEPEVYKAFSGLDDESSNMLMNLLAAPASILRAGATLTPDFALRNPIRDVAQAFVTSKSGFNPVVDFPIGLYQTITKGKYYKDWIDNLGAYGNTLSMDRNMHREALEKVLKQPMSKKFVNVLNGKSLIKILRSISDTTESATKVGEFRKALKKGQTPQEAAYRARDLMDFARAGTSIKPANRIISFLNANIQGKSKLLRSIKENPAATLTKMFTGVTVPTIGIYAWNHYQANETQRQTIDEAPNWQKDAFWLLAVPGTDMVARIPKPFDIAPLFANLPERVLDNIYRNNPVEMGEWLKNSLTESALPTQISGLLPLIEGMSGFSFFRQGDVVPEREKGLELKDQYDPVRTSEVAKLLASGVRSATGEEGIFKNFGSPRIMDNTIKGLTAGLGTYATDAIDSLLKGPTIPFTGGKKMYKPLLDRPTPPEKRLEQAPFARSFFADPLGSTESMDKMYKEKNKLTTREASAQHNGEEPTLLGKKKVHLPLEQAERFVQLNEVTKSISDINKEIRAIEADKVKTAKQKRDELEPLLAERNKLSIEVMKNQKR